MKNSTEQYRVGFEAWARSEGMSTTFAMGREYLSSQTRDAWHVWLASKRESKTDPSVIPSEPYLGMLGYGIKHYTHPVSLPDEAHVADPRHKFLYREIEALIADYGIENFRIAAGVRPDEAKDAARLDWLMGNNSDHSPKIKGMDSMGWFIYDPRTDTSSKFYGSSREAIDAAIAQSKAGKGEA